MTEEFVTREGHNYKKSTIINVKSKKPKAAKSRNYLDNERFYALLKQRQESDDKTISNELGLMFYQLCAGLASKYNFAGLHYNDEMTQDAVVRCISKIDKFDCNFTDNPFSYFTMVAYYEFLERIKKEKRQHYVKCKAYSDAKANGGLFNCDDEEMREIIENFKVNLNFENDKEIGDFIAEYEKNNNINVKRAKRQ